MLKLLSLVLAAVAASSTAPMFAPDEAESPAAASPTGAPSAMVLGGLRHLVERREAPAAAANLPLFSGDDGDPAPCGFSYDEEVGVAVGDRFLYGEFDTEEEADAFIDVEKNRLEVELAFFESRTEHLPCGLCEDLMPCRRWCWYQVGDYGIGIAYNTVTGKWQAYLECTEAMSILVSCRPCPL